MSDRKRKVNFNQEDGSALMELLIALVISGVVSLALTVNSISAFRTTKITEVNYIANNLALSKIEEMAAYDPVEIDTSFNATETAVASAAVNFTFTRTTTVTINADNSRSVDVQVSSNHSALQTQASFNTRFTLWE